MHVNRPLGDHAKAANFFCKEVVRGSIPLVSTLGRNKLERKRLLNRRGATTLKRNSSL